jgi:hypothetical protein
VKLNKKSKSTQVIGRSEDACLHKSNCSLHKVIIVVGSYVCVFSKAVLKGLRAVRNRATNKKTTTVGVNVNKSDRALRKSVCPQNSKCFFHKFIDVFQHICLVELFQQSMQNRAMCVCYCVNETSATYNLYGSIFPLTKLLLKGGFAMGKQCC